MKIQCPCGAKYSFDVTPGSAFTPVKFVCPACGLDSSEAVNEMIRRELAAPAPDVAMPPPPPPAPVAPKVVARISGLKLAREHAPVATAAEPAGEPAAPSGLVCAKHHERAGEKCAVCHKPICPKCMELFGYFCSPFCKSKAEATSIKVPVYAGQFANVDARFWRKAGLIIYSLVGLVCLLLGAAVWWNFYAKLPHAIFAKHYDQYAEAGQSLHVAPDQLVFLHGGTMARYDLGTKKEIWSLELVSQKEVDDLTARMAQEQSGAMYRTGSDQLQKMARAELEGGLTLLGSGKNLWLAHGNLLTHYDWDTGNVLQTLTLGQDRGEMVAGDGELLMMRESSLGAKFITHVNYATGESRTEVFHSAGKMTVVTPGPKDSGTGLPSVTGDPDRPLDPSKVAEQAQNLTTPARIALPALVANSMHQQAIAKEIQDDEPKDPKPSAPATSVDASSSESFTLVSGKNGYVQYTVKLLEEHITTHEAMKAAPSHRVMDGNLTAGQGPEAANEILNDMQRDRGGDKVTEDESKYQVTLRRPDDTDAPDWVGEVIGPPVVYSLKTVNVIAAGKTVTVLDKANKKLWTASLLYDVSPDRTGPNGEDSQFGAGSCVEHGDTLYVADQAVLTAFDLATGEARWRLPSVGIVGLFFDDHGDVYVNTTTANPDKVKYSRQIDIEESIDALVLKVDAKTGKNLWTAKTGGYAAYVSGPYVYTFQGHDLPEDDMANDLTSALQKKPFMKIIRLNPQNGQYLWEHDDDKCPLDVKFDQNAIYLIFHRQVQVLKYLTL